MAVVSAAMFGAAVDDEVDTISAAIQVGLARLHTIVGVPGKRQAQCAFTAAVGAHQYHQRPGRNIEGDGFEDVAVTDLDAQIAYLQQGVRGGHRRSCLLI